MFARWVMSLSPDWRLVITSYSIHYTKLYEALFVESNPIPVKWAVSEMGLISPMIRLPLTPYSARHHEVMREAMRTAGVEHVITSYSIHYTKLYESRVRIHGRSA